MMRKKFGLSVRSVLRLSLFTPMAFLLTGALNVLIDESKNMIMADPASVPVGTIVDTKKGAVFYRQPLGRTHVAAISSDLRFVFLGQDVLISKDQQLILSQVSGATSSQLPPRALLYCTAARETGKKRIVGMSELAETGMDLDAIRKLRHIRTQNCVIDDGSDGTANRAFVADTSNRQDIVPVAVTGTPMTLHAFQRMPGESEARIVFDGPVGIIGNMSVSLEIVEEGKRLAFGGSQSMFRSNDLPKTLNMFGAQITVLSYDKASKTGKIRIDRPFPAQEYGITTRLERR